MEKQKTGFWRGFTWKRMLKYFVAVFLLTLGLDMAWDHSHVGKFFQPGSLLKRFLMAAFLSFIFSLWHEPAIDDVPQKAQRRDA